MLDHNARRAALLRLLEDWEAGRMTHWSDPEFAGSDRDLWMNGLVASGADRGYRCLTPAGIATARAEKEGCHDRGA